MFFMSNILEQGTPKLNSVTTTQKERVFICKEVWKGTTEQNKCVLIRPLKQGKEFSPVYTQKLKKKKKFGSQIKHNKGQTKT